MSSRWSINPPDEDRYEEKPLDAADEPEAEPGPDGDSRPLDQKLQLEAPVTEVEAQLKQSLLVEEIAARLWQIELLAKGVERPVSRFADLGHPNRFSDTAAQIALKVIGDARVIPFQEKARP